MIFTRISKIHDKSLNMKNFSLRPFETIPTNQTTDMRVHEGSNTSNDNNNFRRMGQERTREMYPLKLKSLLPFGKKTSSRSDIGLKRANCHA